MIQFHTENAYAKLARNSLDIIIYPATNFSL